MTKNQLILVCVTDSETRKILYEILIEFQTKIFLNHNDRGVVGFLTEKKARTGRAFREVVAIPHVRHLKVFGFLDSFLTVCFSRRAWNLSFGAGRRRRRGRGGAGGTSWAGGRPERASSVGNFWVGSWSSGSITLGDLGSGNPVGGSDSTLDKDSSRSVSKDDDRRQSR